MMKRSTLVLLAILLAAAALRFYRIEAQSLWSDEGASVVQATRDLPAIVENSARDIHPPLYYILLHFWVVPFGTSEAGVRSLSALLGVALVLMCYLLGRQLWDERTGLLGAALAAINPFQVYYSQEARMYMLMALLGALCVYATVRGLGIGDRGQGKWLIIYGGSAILGLYTHYLFPIVLAVCNTIVIASPRALRGRGNLSGHDASGDCFGAQNSPRNDQRHKVDMRSVAFGKAPLRAFVSWWLVQMVVVLAFLPWLPVALRQLASWPAGPQTFGASEALLVVLRTLSEGLSAPRNDAPWLALFALFVLLGLLPLGRSSRIALVYLLAPLAVMFALMLFKDAFLKFLLVASPPFVLLVANGMMRPSAYAARVARPATRVVAPALLLLLAVPSALAMQNYYFDPHFARDDYRGLAQWISALGRPDDAIMLDAPGQQEIFNYYYHGSTPVYPLPRQRPADAAATQRELEAIAADHRRIFALFWATDESDPARVVESWLSTHTFKASDRWYGNVRLAMYASTRTKDQHPLNAQWEQGISLVSYSDAGQEPNAGDVMPLTLNWHADQPLSTRYKVFVHLLDPRGFVVAQHDSEPAGGARPTTTWQPGETILDDNGLLIPFGTPPLNYRMEFGLYDPETGQRLRTTTGADHVTSEVVRVLPAPQTPPLAAFEMEPVNGITSSGLQLLGYRLGKLGAEGQSDATIHAGDAVHLVLFWRKRESSPEERYRLSLGTLVRETTATDGLYPLEQWGVGEVVRDDQIIALPADWPAGQYPLTLNGQTLTAVDVR